MRSIGTRILPSDHVPLLPITEEIRNAAVDAAAVPMRRFATTLVAEFAARRWFTNDEPVRSQPVAPRRIHGASPAPPARRPSPGQVLMDRDPSTAVITDWLPVYATDPIPAPRGLYDSAHGAHPRHGRRPLAPAASWWTPCPGASGPCASISTTMPLLRRPNVRDHRATRGATPAKTMPSGLATVLRASCSEGIAERAPCEVVGMARKLLRKEACPRGLCDIYDNKDE